LGELEFPQIEALPLILKSDLRAVNQTSGGFGYFHWRIPMKREARRDPRPGLPTAEERRKTTEPLNRESDKAGSEREAVKRAVKDLDSPDPRNA